MANLKCKLENHTFKSGSVQPGESYLPAGQHVHCQVRRVVRERQRRVIVGWQPWRPVAPQSSRLYLPALTDESSVHIRSRHLKFRSFRRRCSLAASRWFIKARQCVRHGTQYEGRLGQVFHPRRLIDHVHILFGSPILQAVAVASVLPLFYPLLKVFADLMLIE